jgi:hypothetical protein
MSANAIQARRDGLFVQLQNLNQRIARLRADYQPIFDRHPQKLQQGDFYAAASRIVSAKNAAGSNQNAGVAVSVEQSAVIVRASFSELDRAQSLAKVLLLESNNEQFVRNEPRIKSLIENNKRVLARLKDTVESARTPDTASSFFSRIVGLNGADGLGEPLTILLVGAVVIWIIGIVAVYSLIRHIYDSQKITADVEAACAADARTGRPCTGEQMIEYRNAIGRQNRENGPVDPIAQLFGQIGSGINALFWIFGIGIVGYGVFVTLPAAMAARERLKRESESRLLPTG